MPTPFYHLALAQSLLADPRLSPRATEWLAAERSAFLFGNTAPDVQTVSGQPREATHFFVIPPKESRPPHETMFARFNGLAQPDRLPAAHAAFMAGYICHLLLDLMWINEIYLPAFGPEAAWSSFRERLVLHNVLRAYLDRRDLPQLDGDVEITLRSVRPDRWLPFETDAALGRWRDVLADQLRPGEAARTVEIFAARAHLDPAQFEAVLDSPDEMQSQVFAHAAPAELDAFRARALTASLELIDNYIGRQ